MKTPDEATNEVTKLLGEFAALLVTRHRKPPETVAKAAIALAIQLYLEYNTDDLRSAAQYLRAFADELDDQAAARPVTVN